jgi:hypothetical protein
MSIDRQYGMHEIPGTEAPAPQKRETVSGGFELQMRGYVNAIWAKLAELEGKIDDFEGWRIDIAEALKQATGFDPRDLSSRGRPLLVSTDGGEARGREGVRPPSSPRPRPAPAPAARPWEAEGVSKATWYRRHREAAP